jgi:hypothetical protein
MHLIISLTAIFGYLFTKIYNNFNRDLSSKQYIIFTIILILIVGLRGVGVDNDYSTYESSMCKILLDLIRCMQLLFLVHHLLLV